MYNRIVGFVALAAAVGLIGAFGCTKATEPAEDEAVVEEVQVEEVAPPAAPAPAEQAPADETEE